MAIRAITFDAYGTLIKNEGLLAVPERIVADHGLTVGVDAVLKRWIAGYAEGIRRTPFRTLRLIQEAALTEVLRELAVRADALPYVELFFRVTTEVELYPEVLPVLEALRAIPAAVVSNADHEHLAAWRFTLPVQFILISEAVQAYKPDPRIFRAAMARLGVAPDEILHVGDSDVDDVQGARGAGFRVAWLNRARRPRRAGMPAPDFEIASLDELPALLTAAR